MTIDSFILGKTFSVFLLLLLFLRWIGWWKGVSINRSSSASINLSCLINLFSITIFGAAFTRVFCYNFRERIFCYTLYITGRLVHVFPRYLLNETSLFHCDFIILNHITMWQIYLLLGLQAFMLFIFFYQL